MERGNGGEARLEGTGNERLMSPVLAEFIGTALLVTFGNGVVANVVLSRTKGNNSGWIVIAAGWGLAVFVAVFSSQGYSGAHINPAVTVAMAAAGKLPWFCTAPNIRNIPQAFFCEVVGTFLLVLPIFLMKEATVRIPGLSGAINEAPIGLGTLGALPVGLLVFAIGLSLGGTTGYAINPARDLAPRLAHAFLPVTAKGESDWGYGWVPVVGPV